MHGPREHYDKWIKPVGERQIPYDVTHMWNLMTNWTNKQNRDRLIDGELWGIEGGQEVEGWSKKEKGPWTWTTVWWLQGWVGWGEVEEGIGGINGNGKKYNNNKNENFSDLTIPTGRQIEEAGISNFKHNEGSS